MADLGASAPWREHRARPRNWESGKRSKRLRLLHRLKQSLQLQHPHRHPGGSRWLCLREAQSTQKGKPGVRPFPQTRVTKRMPEG
jgi:hypothetical protein